MTEPVENKEVAEDGETLFKHVYVVKETKSDFTPGTEIQPKTQILGETVFEDRYCAAAAIAYKLAECMSQLAAETIEGHDVSPFHLEFFSENENTASIDYGLDRHDFEIVPLKVRGGDYTFVEAEDS